eukprot:73835-Pyramimonas_sp.AAC.1
MVQAGGGGVVYHEDLGRGRQHALLEGEAGREVRPPEEALAVKAGGGVEVPRRVLVVHGEHPRAREVAQLGEVRRALVQQALHHKHLRRQ